MYSWPVTLFYIQFTVYWLTRDYGRKQLLKGVLWGCNQFQQKQETVNGLTIRLEWNL